LHLNRQRKFVFRLFHSITINLNICDKFNFIYILIAFSEVCIFCPYPCFWFFLKATELRLNCINTITLNINISMLSDHPDNKDDIIFQIATKTKEIELLNLKLKQMEAMERKGVLKASIPKVIHQMYFI
jgi:hypothetical protein